MLTFLAQKFISMTGNGKETSLPIPRYGIVESMSPIALLENWQNLLKTCFTFFTQAAIFYLHCPFLSSESAVFSKHKPGNGCGFGFDPRECTYLEAKVQYNAMKSVKCIKVNVLTIIMKRTRIFISYYQTELSLSSSNTCMFR